MRQLHFNAMGVPQPQGSARAFVRGDRAVVTSDNARLKPWRNLVVNAAWEAMDREPTWTPIEGAAIVMLTFRLPRPKTVKRDKPTVRPDLDKLARAVLDSLTTARVYRDDAQVCGLFVSKGYAGEGQTPGVTVTVTTMEDQ